MRPADPKHPPRIMFYMPGLAMGGAERHSIDLRRRLAAKGYSTSVVVHSDVASPAMQRMAGAEDVLVLGLRGMSSLSGWPKIFRVFKTADADIILCINQSRAIWAVLLRAFGATRARIVCLFHTTLLRPEDEKKLPLFRLAARFVDVMVYVSRNQMAYWSGRGLRARRSMAIVNGVDLGRFVATGEGRAAAKARLGLKPDDFTVGLLASFRPEKNHIELVEAAIALARRGTPIKVIFVGAGATRTAVEAKVAELGATDQVIFAGEFDDVRPVIAAFDVGVLCSTDVETFSLAALEILASGAPMVMTDIGGASEIVDPGVNGFLYKPGDVNALSGHLGTLSDAAILAGFQARARPSVERYSIKTMMAGYLSLIDELSPRYGASARGKDTATHVNGAHGCSNRCE